MLLCHSLYIYWMFSFYFSSLLFSFTMHNTGKVALEYSWEKVGDSEEAVMKPYSKTLMCKGISLGS